MQALTIARPDDVLVLNSSLEISDDNAYILQAVMYKPPSAFNKKKKK